MCIRDSYASDALKAYVESGGEELKKCISNDKGEIMAIPAPSMMGGEVNEMWTVSYTHLDVYKRQWLRST